MRTTHALQRAFILMSRSKTLHQRVGKIGEGVRLTLSFRQRAKHFRSTVGIYLPDCDGFIRTWIAFEIQDGGRVQALCDGDPVADEP